MKPIVMAIQILILIVLATGSWMRNQTWNSREALYRDVVTKSPNKPRPRIMLCQELLEQNRYDEARSECQTLITVADRRFDQQGGRNCLQSLTPCSLVYSGDSPEKDALVAEGALINLAAMEMNMAQRNVETGDVRFTRLGEAQRLMQEVFHRDPSTDITEAYLNMGVLYLRGRQPREALKVIWIGRKKDPMDRKLMFAEGAAYAQLGNCKFADIMWQNSFRTSIDFSGTAPKCASPN